MMRGAFVGFLLVAVSCAEPERGPPEPGDFTPPPPVGFEDNRPEEPEEPEEPDEPEEPEEPEQPEQPEHPVLDIAPDVEDLGLTLVGSSCPSITPADSLINAGAVTSYTFDGTVTGATGNGAFYVRGRNAEEIAGEISMAGSSYSITLPVFCGDNIVKRAWSNATCTAVLVTELNTTDCVDAELRVTTVWDGGGRDWELHLVKPGGSINDNATDCTWTSCIHSQPDWGVLGDASDNPRKDVDWLQAYGPENIWLDGLEPGVYTIMVEHWSSSGSSTSDGRVIINMADKLVVVDITDLAPHHVWIAARIQMPERIVQTSHEIYDCSANWSGGCRDALP